MDYKLSNLGESLFLNVPEIKYYDMAVQSPNGRYLASGKNNLLLVVDTDREYPMFVYDIFTKVDTTKIIVTDHPLIAVRDIVSLGTDRQNVVYLLNHRSDVLFRASIDANVHMLAISIDGSLIAIQSLDNKLRLFRVTDMQEISVWKTPGMLATELIIDSKSNEVRMVDHLNLVYSYSFETP